MKGLYMTPYKSVIPSSAFALKVSGNWYPLLNSSLKSASSKLITNEPSEFLSSDLGTVLTLEKLFTKYVDYNFTADLENQLDEISDGKLEWKEVLRNFWETFKQLCDDTVGKSNREVIDVLDDALGAHFFPPEGKDESRKCPTCENGRLGIKVGKFGGFIGCSNYPDCK